MALSPAKTKSIKMMASKADHHGAENSSTANSTLTSITARGGAEKRGEWEPDRRFAAPHGCRFEGLAQLVVMLLCAQQTGSKASY
jgi:hypothetical protein